MAFFQCEDHTDEFYLLPIRKVKETKRDTCPCFSRFNDKKRYKSYSLHDVESYSKSKHQRWLEKAQKETPPGWFWVSRMGCFLRKKDGTNLLFYRFAKFDRSGEDYKCAKRIEDVTWNRPKQNKAFYLMRFAHEMDALHAEGKIKFQADGWNRGGGMEYFKEFLQQNDII